MGAISSGFFVCVVAVLSLTLFFIWKREKKHRQALENCSDALQEIFKILEEPSVLPRILSKETPEQELARLKETLQVRGQKALHENDALLRIFANLPDGVAALNAAFNVVFCNSKFCRLVNIPDEDHSGKKIFEILRHHAALNAADDFLGQAKDDFREIEFLAGEKNLKMRMIRFKGGTTAETIIVLSDITALKKLEQMRREFVANVSHELRTPLTSVQGFVETLLDGTGVDDATRKHFLGLIKTDTERLRRLLEDLLALSRIESQARNFEKHRLHVLTDLEEVAGHFALRFKQKQIHFDLSVETGLVLPANRDQFRQVLVNLLDNAVKFTPEKGKITVSAARNKENVEIRIGDSGPGVLPENREKIFQRFFREDKARSRETGGTGLGLSIVKHIMEAHGGKAQCAGQAGEGSVFVLSFPSETHGLL